MTTTTIQRRGPAPFSDALVLTGRSLRHAVRQPEVLILGLALPVLLMLLLTTVFGGAMDTGGGPYIDYLAPGVIILVAGYGAALTAASVTEDMTKGIVARFRTMPMRPSAVLTGHVAASVLRNLVSTVLAVGAALAVGFRPAAGVAGWAGVFGLVALYVLAVSWLAAAVGLLARTVEAASASSFVLLFLPYVSSAFVPVHTLPSWLHGFAEHTPFTPIIESLRALLFGQPVGAHLGPALAWLLGVLVVGMVGSSLLWRRSRR
ncbi:MAG TPA: ABC transporter permease [Actinomycetaceae bacterium]|nr:ABC transporter permease [Actinomycetaceae bacterium]